MGSSISSLIMSEIQNSALIMLSAATSMAAGYTSTVTFFNTADNFFYQLANMQFPQLFL